MTAFLSGAPGGREVEPSRPGRTIVGGVALAVLLLAGGAVASVLSPRASQDWNSPGLVISKESGERYVITSEAPEGQKPLLRPVINVTSAQLILGLETEPRIVSSEVLDGVTPGDDIGILGAPQELPRPADFIDTGWTACTVAGRGVAVDIARKPRTEPVGSRRAMLVSSEGTQWVIAQGHPGRGVRDSAFRYRIGRDINADALLGELNLPIVREAVEVPAAWLALFPEGGALGSSSFPLERRGQAPRVTTEVAPRAKVGDYLTFGGSTFVVTDQGPAPLDDFAAAVYRSLDRARPAAGGELDSAPRDQQPSPARDTSWPQRSPTATVDDELCAVLDVAADRPAAVQLGTAPRGTASSRSVPKGDRVPHIDEGGGAFVRSAAWGATSGTSAWVVDDKAAAYPLQGKETLAKLTYDARKAPLVPDSWIELLGRGVVLSTERALCPPVASKGTPCA